MPEYVFGYDPASPSGDYSCVMVVEVLRGGRLRVLGFMRNVSLRHGRFMVLMGLPGFRIPLVPKPL
jgi:hypothetical protein